MQNKLLPTFYFKFHDYFNIILEDYLFIKRFFSIELVVRANVKMESEEKSLSNIFQNKSGSGKGTKPINTPLVSLATKTTSVAKLSF